MNLTDQRSRCLIIPRFLPYLCSHKVPPPTQIPQKSQMFNLYNNLLQYGRITLYHQSTSEDEKAYRSIQLEGSERKILKSRIIL